MRWRYGDASVAAPHPPFPRARRSDDAVHHEEGRARSSSGAATIASSCFRHGAAGPRAHRRRSGRLAERRTLELHGFGERPGRWASGCTGATTSASFRPASRRAASALEALAAPPVRVGQRRRLRQDARAPVGRASTAADATTVRVSFADAEKRLKPWPAAPLTGVKGLGGEGDVTYAKDPSTATRLVRRRQRCAAVPGGGLIPAIGGQGVTPPRARREPLGDGCTRCPATACTAWPSTAAGRVLAAWEKEPVIHLFSFAQRQHVALPKPNLPFTVEGKTYNTFHVDEDLAFAPNGRDAIVFTIGPGGRKRALDHRGPRRRAGRPVGTAADSSASTKASSCTAPGTAPCSRCRRIRGRSAANRTLLAHPRHRRVRSIVGEHVTQRTLLEGAHGGHGPAPALSTAATTPTWASVLDLVSRNGVQRLNGGRALLRWRWRDAQRSLPPAARQQRPHARLADDEEGRLRRGRAPLRGQFSGWRFSAIPAGPVSRSSRRFAPSSPAPRQWAGRTRRRRPLAAVGRAPRADVTRQAVVQLQRRAAQAARVGVGRRADLRREPRVALGRPRRSRPSVRAPGPRRRREALEALAGGERGARAQDVASTVTNPRTLALRTMKRYILTPPSVKRRALWRRRWSAG